MRLNELTAQRDKFIADAIEGTLKEGELGVLFIGAYHNVSSELASDITVRMVKDPTRVGAYFRELLSGEDPAKLEAVAAHLTAPVEDL